MKHKRRNRKIKGFYKSYFSGFLRAALTAAIVLLQFFIIFALAYRLSTAGIYVYFGIQVIGFVIIISLLNRHTNYLFKLSWLSLITLIPVAGLIMYFLWGRERNLHKVRKAGRKLLEYGQKFETSDEDVDRSFADVFPEGVRQVKYLENHGFVLYKDNSFEYYTTGEDAFEAVIEDIEKARRFIFISFFIVADGGLWRRIRPILEEKAHQGVDVRLIFDDFGSMFRTDKQIWQDLADAGVKVGRFNPVHKYVSKLYLNYRNHQKIIVIDGNVCYTGGFNLADEYVNAIVRFGYWKDGGVRIEGPAVFGMTRIFLDMWGVILRSNKEDYSKYRPDKTFEKSDRYCQAICGGPINPDSSVIESSIMQMIYNSKDFLYITTPYLILEDSLSEALCIQARSGVDVRLVIPGIPDKKAVYELTKYNCGKLLENGVRIFVYTPGFVHNKSYVTRDCVMMGSINLDYRSFYLHFECGEFMWDRELVESIKADYMETFGQCREMTFEEWKNRPLSEKMKQWVLNIFSALM